MYSSEGVPPWAAADQSTCTPQEYFAPYCTSTVSNLQYWDDFVTQLVTRYRGRIQIYELWNEPSQRFTGTMEQLVVLTQHEHDIIRSIDPAATILSPAVIAEGSAYLDSYFAAGGTVDIDAVAMHGYSTPTNDIAEMITQSISTSIKSVMGKYGLSAKALWNTETSWGPQNKGAITDPDLQAAFVARAYFLDWSIGISRFYWYAWDSPVVGTLWTPGSAPTEPAVAYEQVRNWITGATMPQPCSINGAASAYHAVYTCDLTRSAGYEARAVWNTDGPSTYAAPAQYVQYRDLQGNVFDVPTSHQVTIGHKPILLENK
ncbi:MAG: glycosyl hydrolase, partial [Candidatus Acidiferrales bacterium]